jgi:hypothetical protein
MSDKDQLREARSILYQALPALGLHGRGFSQEALIRACDLLGDVRPEDWTAHPEVMARRREILRSILGADVIGVHGCDGCCRPDGRAA